MPGATRFQLAPSRCHRSRPALLASVSANGSRFSASGTSGMRPMAGASTMTTRARTPPVKRSGQGWFVHSEREHRRGVDARVEDVGALGESQPVVAVEGHVDGVGVFLEG